MRADAIYMTCRDCQRENIRVVGRGLCSACYDRHWNAKTLDQFPRKSRDPKPIPTAKRCASCKRLQPIDAFTKNNRRSDGYGSYCKVCARRKYQAPARRRNRLVERPAEGEQQCRECTAVKPVGDFYWEADKGRHKPDCKVCVAAKGKLYWERAGSTNQWRYTLKVKFGLTEADYRELLDTQRGVCAICGRSPDESGGRKLAVDHCHETGIVRGLLCSACNCGLGMLGDDAERVALALNYLNKGAAVA